VPQAKACLWSFPPHILIDDGRNSRTKVMLAKIDITYWYRVLVTRIGVLLGVVGRNLGLYRGEVGASFAVF